MTAPKICLGVCAMSKKATCKPMQEILRRMNSDDVFEIIIFEEQTILHQPVEAWPCCHVLLSWFSDGFPLHKARDYVQLRRPRCINDLEQQQLLMDRRQVYRTLQAHDIPVPPHIVVPRSEHSPEADPPGFAEHSDWVEMNGSRINKPFVEKPLSGEDHNVYIYPKGGGVKCLFRKVENKSSVFLACHSGGVRRVGSFIYEEFLETGGTDVKVYSVGPSYAYAESRKSPGTDGVVERTADGGERRSVVQLSPQEQDIARRVSLAFGQAVCGLDLLRCSDGRSVVCDVNGWSFVKHSAEFFDNAARVLRRMALDAGYAQRAGQQHGRDSNDGSSVCSGCSSTAADADEELSRSSSSGCSEGLGFGDVDLHGTACSTMGLAAVPYTVPAGSTTDKIRRRRRFLRPGMLLLLGSALAALQAVACAALPRQR